MKEIQFLINDVREQTDNRDENGVKDREFIRYFNDGIKTIQTMIFKNNPLSSYYQESVEFTPLTASRVYDLPSDVYADNAVARVEVKSGNIWNPIDRAWPEEGNTFFGWYTENKKLILTGQRDLAYPNTIKVTYFQRLPRFDKAWATVDSAVEQVLTISGIDTEMFRVDRFISILTVDGEVRVANLSYVKTSDTTLTVVGDISDVVAGDVVVMGKNSLITLDMPEECEPYLMDYVAQRIVGRNNYGEDWNKMNYWTSEERANILSIFADASQAEVRAPITDTDYMRI